MGPARDIYSSCRPTRVFWFHSTPGCCVSCCLQASLNFDDPTLEALLKALPEAPAMAQRQCLQRCGLDAGSDDDNLSYNYDSLNGSDKHRT